MESHDARCACNAIRYRFTGQPYAVYLCHCTICQSRTGSAFGMSMHVCSRNLEILEGEPASVKSGTGRRLIEYCEKCRTMLFLKTSQMYADAPVTCIFPGCFEDKSWFKPSANVWVRSAQPWLTIDKNLKCYEEQPESWLELYS
ncbi:MAG: GFA family protein [Congregibacter sp.]